MIHQFVTWFDHQPWHIALAFMLGVIAFLCGVIVLIDWWIRGAESRAIAKRDRKAFKAKQAELAELRARGLL